MKRRMHGQFLTSLFAVFLAIGVVLAIPMISAAAQADAAETAEAEPTQGTAAPTDAADNFAIAPDWIQAAIALVAAVAAFLAIQASYKNNVKQIADQSWEKYLELAFLNPKLADPSDNSACTIDYEKKTVDGKSEDFQKYIWFVSLLLSVVMTMKRAYPKDKFRDQMLLLQLSYHKQYFERALVNPRFEELTDKSVIDMVKRAKSFSGPYFYDEQTGDPVKVNNA